MLREKGRPGPKAKAMAYVSQVKGLSFYYFTPEQVDIENKKIHALKWLNGQWIQEFIDYPLVIDNDISSLKNKAVCEDLLTYSHFTTQILGGKLKTLQRIQTLPDYQNIIIPYELVKNEQQLRDFVKKNKYIVIKPIGGNQGKNIQFISWENAQFQVNDMGHITVYDDERFSDFYQEKVKGRSLITQKYISSMTTSGQAFDVRVHVQRNGQCEWEITKIYARIGSGKGLIANLSAGGSMADGKLFLQHHFPHHFQKIYTKIRNIGMTLPQAFQDFYTREIDSLGIDLGIDQSGHIWLFEINSFPGSKYFEFERALTRVDYLEAILNKNNHFTKVMRFEKYIKEQNYKLIVDNRNLKQENNIVLLKSRKSKTGMVLNNIKKFIDRIKVIIYDNSQLDRSEFPKTIDWVYVDNIDHFLFQVARHFRKEFSGNIYTVVGSVGKTSTSSLLSRMLKSLDANTMFNLKGNTPFYIANGIFGLQEQRQAIFEVAGAGLVDEKPIGLVSHELLQPKICLFTTLAPAHIEKIGSMQAIAERKARAFEAMPIGSILIMNRDTEYFDYMMSFVPEYVKIYTYGTHFDSDFKLLTHYDDCMQLDVKGIHLNVKVNELAPEIRLNYLGIIATLSIMFPKTWKASLPLLESVAKVHGRGKEVYVTFNGKDIEVIDESYNANPSSMKLALTTFNNSSKNNKIIVISEMLELGKYSISYHQDVIDLIKKMNFNQIILIGDIFNKVNLSCEKEFIIVNQLSELEKKLKDVIEANSTILFKGSNGTGLNNFVKAKFYAK